MLGTAFHDWVQRFYGAERLFDLDDLPGAVDGDRRQADAEELADLQAAFMASPWAARTPVDVEVPFEMVIARHVVRGRIDAVFADADGGVTVVDWKTGDPPADADARRHAAVQLGGVPVGVGGAARLPGILGAGGLPLRAQRADRHPRPSCRAPTNWSRC